MYKCSYGTIIMKCFTYTNFNTASILWIFFLLCYTVSALDVRDIRIPQEVPTQTTGKHKYQKILNYRVSEIRVSQHYAKDKSLNNAKYRKREVPLLNNPFEFIPSNAMKVRSVINRNTDAESFQNDDTISMLNLETPNELHNTNSPPFEELGSGLYTPELINTEKGVHTQDIKSDKSDNENLSTVNSTISFKEVSVHEDDFITIHTHSDIILVSCLETSCNSSEQTGIAIYPKRIAVELGNNVTFKCTLSTNSTKTGSVFWFQTKEYFSNITFENETTLHLSNTQPSDSGIYKCIKWHQGNCCHASAILKVYEKPPYITHLIIVGTIASVGLIICIAVQVWRSHRMRQNKSQDKAAQKEDQLLQQW